MSGGLRRFDDQPVVREPQNELVMRSLLRGSDSGADLSITWVQLAGHHRRLVTDASTRVYVILEGRGRIRFDDHPLEVSAGDTIVIPAGQPYDLDGPMTYLVMNQPAFQDGDDRYLPDVGPG